MTPGEQHADILVLGAGMVGISAALHLQRAGRSVVLADRRGPAEETSFGNAGLIQAEGVVPYSFPRDIVKIAQYAFNRLPEANLHWRAIPWLLPFVYRYWRHGAPERIAATARAMLPLVSRSSVEHEALMREAGVESHLRRTGFLRAYRSAPKFEKQIAEEETARQLYGVTYEIKSQAELALLEPHLSGGFKGALLMPQAASVPDPAVIGRAYAGLFEGAGGSIAHADAMTLRRDGADWRVDGMGGAIRARGVVLALGPWTKEVAARLGVRIPMGWKRGYHMHYGLKGNAVLNHPLIDGDTGYCVTPTDRGIRLTTGAEFALLSARPTPVQLAKVEPVARAMLPLAERLLEAPWMGARPCLPDLVPMIGPVPGHRGLWIDTAHHHLGFTLGPVTGKLLAQLVAGEEPLCDPAPYRVGRF